VRDFKTRLVRLARTEAVTRAVAARRNEILGRMLVGAGGRVARGPHSLALIVGPQRLIDAYARFLKDSGETATLPRIYPRDFWPDE
jgi:hypothetical protein